MFNVGDRVVCVMNGCGLDIGEIYNVKLAYYSNVVLDNFVFLEEIEGPFLASRFKLYERVDNSISPVVRKIRSMYARQYRKTKQPCFL